MKPGTQKLLKKAERAIRAAQILLDSDDPESAAGRSYYAMFYVAEALLFERDLQFSSHGAVHAAYGKEFAKTKRLEPRYHRWILDAFDNRLESDYSFESAPSTEDVTTTLDQARAFLAAARDFLANE